MKFRFLGIVISLALSACGQSSDCTKILKKEINQERLEFATDEFNADLKTLVNCELEPVDYQILVGPKEMFPNVAFAVLIKTFEQSDANGKITYENFRNAFLEFKKKDLYNEVKKAAIEYIDFSKQTSSTQNWEKTNETLLKFEFSDSEIHSIKQVIENYKKNGIDKKTFGEIISIIYSNKRKEIKECKEREKK